MVHGMEMISLSRRVSETPILPNQEKRILCIQGTSLLGLSYVLVYLTQLVLVPVRVV